MTGFIFAFIYDIILLVIVRGEQFMSKLFNSISEIVGKIGFKTIRIVTIAAFGATIFFSLISFLTHASNTYASTILSSLAYIVMAIIFLVFVIMNTSFKTYFVTTIVYGSFLIISILITVFSFIDYISWYARYTSYSSYSSYSSTDNTAYLVKNVILYIFDFAGIFTMLAAIILLIVAIKKKQKNGSGSFGLPMILFAVNFVIYVLCFFVVIIIGFTHSIIPTFTNIIIAATWICFSAYLETREKIEYEKPTPVANPIAGSSNLQSNIDYNFMNMGIGTHFLLSIVTLGIWQLIGVYKITRYLSSLDKTYPRDPVTKLLLCFFVPFYSWYWYYKSGEIVDHLNGRANGKSRALLLILSIFYSGGAFLVLIHKANELEFTMKPSNIAENANINTQM